MAGPVRKTAPPPVEAIALLSRKSYVPGFGIPEGDYVIFLTAQRYKFTKSDGTESGNETVGIMVSAYPRHHPSDDPLTEFLTIGWDAHKSVMPSEDGKKLLPIPNGTALKMSNSNWGAFFDSLCQSGITDDVLESQDATDLSWLDGTHVHIARQPESASKAAARKKMRTGENAGEDDRGPRMIPVVTEIFDDGKPWEGTGGLPTEPKAGAKAAVPFRAPAKAAVSAPSTAPVATDDDLKTHALNAISNVLEANPNGLKRLKLKTEAFKELSKMEGVDAQAAMNEWIATDEGLKALLGDLDYQLVGTGPAADVKPIG